MTRREEEEKNRKKYQVTRNVCEIETENNIKEKDKI